MSAVDYMAKRLRLIPIEYIEGQPWNRSDLPHGKPILYDNGVLVKNDNPLAENEAIIAHLVKVLGLTAPEVEKMFEEVWAMLQ